MKPKTQLVREIKTRKGSRKISLHETNLIRGDWPSELDLYPVSANVDVELAMEDLSEALDQAETGCSAWMHDDDARYPEWFWCYHATYSSIRPLLDSLGLQRPIHRFETFEEAGQITRLLEKLKTWILKCNTWGLGEFLPQRHKPREYCEAINRFSSPEEANEWCTEVIRSALRMLPPALIGMDQFQCHANELRRIAFRLNPSKGLRAASTRLAATLIGEMQRSKPSMALELPAVIPEIGEAQQILDDFQGLWQATDPREDAPLAIWKQVEILAQAGCKKPDLHEFMWLKGRRKHAVIEGAITQRRTLAAINRFLRRKTNTQVTPLDMCFFFAGCPAGLVGRLVNLALSGKAQSAGLIKLIEADLLDDYYLELIFSSEDPEETIREIDRWSVLA